MTPAHRPRKTAPAQRTHTIHYGPLWCSDWRKRLRALLPELAVSVVGATCLTTVITFSAETNLPQLFTISLIAQIFIQLLMYVCTYVMSLRDNPWIPYALLLLIGSAPVLWGMFITAPLPTIAPSPVDLTSFSLLVVPVGAGFFWLTRMQPLLGFLVIEMLSVVQAIAELKIALPLHVAFMASFAALYVIRNSATRITVLFEAGNRAQAEPLGQGRRGSSLGMFGQVVGFAAVVVALCLVVALALMPLVSRPSDGHVVATTTSSAIHQEAEPNDSQTKDDVEASGNSASNPVQSHGSTSSITSSSSHPTVPGWLLGLLPPALLALPFAVRLLWRAYVRFSLKHEPQTTNLAARLYLGILARLTAVGIMRDEPETPIEFLSNHEEELEELVAPSGMGLADWMTLTDAYEKARYANIPPTEAELDACWRLYDVLPTCARKQAGWLCYLVRAFWRM